MKKYVRNILYSFLFVLCSLLFALFPSCKTNKNVSRIETVATAVERVETKKDTSRVITTTQSDLDETVSIFETTTRETIHLDDSGRVRSIVKESISKETGQRRHDRGSGSVVSIAGKTDSVSVVESSQVSSNEKTDIKSDSRPVQGVEWIWVIFGIGAIAAIAIIVFIRKIK